jgi:putative transposase
LPYLAGCWGPRGEQTKVPTPGKNKKRVVFGAIRSGGDNFIGAAHLTKNGTAFCELLVQMAHRAKRTRKKIILVSDNARYHKTKAAERLIEEIKPWVEVVWLPKYSSDLNDIERFWKTVKSTFFANTLYRSEEEFAKHVEQVVERLRRDPDATLGLAREQKLAA